MAPQAFIFDFDGTLTRHDLLDRLADALDQRATSQAIRQAFQAGLLDGTTALIQRVGLLRGLSNATIHNLLTSDDLQDGHTALHEWLIHQTAPVIIASGNLCGVVAHYAAYFNAAATFCTQPDLDADGQIIGLQAGNIGKRLPNVLDYLARHQLDPAAVVAIGDDFSDIPFFEACGLSIAFNPTHPRVGEAATYTLTGTLTDLTYKLMDL